MNGCLRERIFPKLNPPKRGVFGQRLLLILFPYLLANTYFLSSLVSLSGSRSTGNVTSEQWFICSEWRLGPISCHVSPTEGTHWPPLLSHFLFYIFSHRRLHTCVGIAVNFILVVWSRQHMKIQRGRQSCDVYTSPDMNMRFAFITTLNAETHVIALMLHWWLQIIALSMII